jgi:hypothetical protein
MSYDPDVGLRHMTLGTTIQNRIFFCFCVSVVLPLPYVGGGCRDRQYRRSSLGSGRPPADALAIWRSPTSTTRERAMAVSILVPQGARLGHVEDVLGQPDYIEVPHGPIYSHSYSTNINGNVYWQPGPVDKYWNEELISYIFQHGEAVTLRFIPDNQSPRRENKQFCGLSTGNTNNWYKLVTKQPD